ncbi:hypothetical protein MJO47_04400 [Desulfuromonas sp. KJ2020]|uniref:hypothetical protein n=1 Tax=Desulfuromonas sp. KJ2020 TaxID=2919173 RepID=UPI0020A80F26|nr:hypothetical protein [Desulfuromonas sp. KJ2020]MCP3176334.1 hypothetical protein [Desulfuromonas sp. KJ2020]
MEKFISAIRMAAFVLEDENSPRKAWYRIQIFWAQEKYCLHTQGGPRGLFSKPYVYYFENHDAAISNAHKRIREKCRPNRTRTYALLYIDDIPRQFLLETSFFD